MEQIDPGDHFENTLSVTVRKCLAPLYPANLLSITKATQKNSSSTLLENNRQLRGPESLNFFLGAIDTEYCLRKINALDC